MNFDQISQLVDLLASKGLIFFFLWIIWKSVVPSVGIICFYKFIRWIMGRIINLYEKSNQYKDQLLKNIEDTFYKKLEEICNKKQ